MALVRISKGLLQDVKHHVGTIASGEYAEIPGYNADLSDAGPGPRMAADAALWGEHLHLRDQIPEAWLKRPDEVHFTTRHVHPDGHPEITAPIKCRIAGLRVPPNIELNFNYGRTGREHFVSVAMEFDVVVALAQDANDPRHALAARIMEVVHHEQAHRATRLRWNKRLEGLNEFFGKCKSLNEAVKLWPGVRIYVPKLYLDQLDTPVVRSQAVVRKERVLATVDTDDLTAAAVAARLQGLA